MVEIHCHNHFFYFKSMRYTAFSTTSSTSFCGQHVQPRCFCIGLANCYFAERGAKRKKGKLNYPVRDKNRKIVQQVRDNLPKDDCWSRRPRLEGRRATALCHKNVILIAMNDGKTRTKGE
jgi:hypothetical protein